MAAITMPHEIPTYNGDSYAATAEAAIQEPYAAVKAGTADGTVIQTSDGTGCLGFIKYETGKTYNVAGSVAQVPILTPVAVFTSGNAYAVAGAAITKGVDLKSATGGQVITHTAAAQVVGKAVTAAAAQHELVTITISLGTAA